MSIGSSVEHARSIWPTDCYKDRAVLVCGGSSGIDAAIAAAFAEAGAKVTFTGATRQEVEAALSNRSLEGSDGVALDLRDPEAVSDTVAALPAIDHLVNCVGVIRRGEEHDPSIFAQVLEINLTGTMRVCAAARPRLAQAGGGTIINTASMLSFFGGGLVPAYSASKGGVAQLTKSLALAYAGDGIRVNAIAPGWINTPLTADLRKDRARNQAILARTPLGRWGEPEDVAGAALFLASPMAAFVTGVVLPIDGGYLVA